MRREITRFEQLGASDRKGATYIFNNGYGLVVEPVTPGRYSVAVTYRGGAVNNYVGTDPGCSFDEEQVQAAMDTVRAYPLILYRFSREGVTPAERRRFGALNLLNGREVTWAGETPHAALRIGDGTLVTLVQGDISAFGDDTVWPIEMTYELTTVDTGDYLRSKAREFAMDVIIRGESGWGGPLREVWRSFTSLSGEELDEWVNVVSDYLQSGKRAPEMLLLLGKMDGLGMRESAQWRVLHACLVPDNPCESFREALHAAAWWFGSLADGTPGKASGSWACVGVVNDYTARREAELDAHVMGLLLTEALG